MFFDLFMYSLLKMVTEKSPVNWSYPLFLESAKLEFHCTMIHLLWVSVSIVVAIVFPVAGGVNAGQLLAAEHSARAALELPFPSQSQPVAQPVAQPVSQDILAAVTRDAVVG